MRTAGAITVLRVTRTVATTGKQEIQKCNAIHAEHRNRNRTPQ